MSFYQRLDSAWTRSGSMLCVGLDPDVARFPQTLRGDVNNIEKFCKEIVDATGDLVCAFKPQIAYFAAVGAETPVWNRFSSAAVNAWSIAFFLAASFYSRV